MSDNRAAMDDAFTTGEDRIAVLIDGRQGGLFSTPVPVPAPVAQPAAQPAAQAPAQAAGPGFWSRLGSGLADLGGQLVDAAKGLEVRRVPATSPATPGATVAEPPPQPPWAWILGGAGAVILLLLLRR